MSERIAFRMNLNPGQAAEYELRHNNVFPELSQALKDAGVSDYSIWFDEGTHHLFAILTRTDDHTMDALPDTEICKRWWAFMADIMETDAHNVPTQTPLKRVFLLP
jgi:L-rhamnose mutarotase